MHYDLEELSKIQANMTKYGGSFVKTLADLMEVADVHNLIRIQVTWPDLFNKYHKMNACYKGEKRTLYRMRGVNNKNK